MNALYFKCIILQQFSWTDSCLWPENNQKKRLLTHWADTSICVISDIAGAKSKVHVVPAITEINGGTKCCTTALMSATLFQYLIKLDLSKWNTNEPPTQSYHCTTTNTAVSCCVVTRNLFMTSWLKLSLTVWPLRLSFLHRKEFAELAHRSWKIMYQDNVWESAHTSPQNRKKHDPSIWWVNTDVQGHAVPKTSALIIAV